ncbi:GTPase family protein [Arthrobacter halodurans]|uniref:GTPase family protein n=1 Tax=Arthrobacter halodurans TaxID=516699 RepID=A0ABV4UI71_9MICC
MSRRAAATAASPIVARLEALERARELGEGRVPEAAHARALAVLERASARRSLSAEHTVVGFFGATGSGKSTLFNAVTGERWARAAATRPTTAAPLAAVWGPAGSAELLDWLEVAERHELGGPLSAGRKTGWLRGGREEPGGLILLDLPDFDSTALEHRDIVRRLSGQVDVLVWVLDPQKYADAAVHDDFIRPLSSHGAVTLVVLNQIDRLPADSVEPVVDSLRRILADDGLGEVRILPASAATGSGVDEVRAAIAGIAGERSAATRRLAADVADAAGQLAAGTGTTALAPPGRDAERRLATHLAQAAGVDTVASAVERSYRIGARGRTGWPVTRWLGRLRPDPLRRLNLRSRDVNPAVNRTSLPPPGAAQRAQSDGAVRAFADEASAGAPEAWRGSIRRAARGSADTLPDDLDQAIARTDIGAGRGSWWWPVVGVVQWIALACALVGAGWLGFLFVLGYLQLGVPAVPLVEGVPVPTLMLAGGVLLGMVLGLATGLLARLAAKARAAAARRRLTSAVAAVARRRIVEPVAAEIGRHNDFVRALAAARG